MGKSVSFWQKLQCDICLVCFNKHESRIFKNIVHVPINRYLKRTIEGLNYFLKKTYFQVHCKMKNPKKLKQSFWRKSWLFNSKMFFKCNQKVTNVLQLLWSKPVKNSTCSSNHRNLKKSKNNRPNINHISIISFQSNNRPKNAAYHKQKSTLQPLMISKKPPVYALQLLASSRTSVDWQKNFFLIKLPQKPKSE